MLDNLTRWLKGLFESFFAGIVDLAKNLVLTIFDLQKDIFFFIIDSLLEFVVHLLDNLGSDFAAAFNPSTYIDNLPSEVLNVMGLVGIGECFTIIGSAIIIRLTLQLIPFVRLGS